MLKSLIFKGLILIAWLHAVITFEVLIFASPIFDLIWKEVSGNHQNLHIVGKKYTVKIKA